MSAFYPTLQQVRALANRGRTIPIIRRLPADQLTPVVAFARLGLDADRAFLLESVVGGERLARYSFIGFDPDTVFRSTGDQVRIERPGAAPEIRSGVADPLAALQETVAEFASVPSREFATPALPVPRFTGGAVGFAAYDAARCYERLGAAPPDDRGLADLDFGIHDCMVIFDHVAGAILVVAHARLDGDIDKAHADACKKIDAIIDRLNRPAAPLSTDLDLAPTARPPFTSTMTRTQFEDAVRRSIEYIRAGDIFQVVLSQRLRVESAADPFNVYRALRVINPSPFMFFLRGPDCTLVGASPEVLCRVEDGVVTNRPLAGTRKRGATAEEDADLERELLADPKDRAEHIMLVDLGRNDVGRVAEPGTVRLTDVMSVERYSHVMHISSNITGRLPPDRTAVDALRAALPVGTVSGAPKIRAMQIIDELEPVRRGPYGGAVGYLDFRGNMDTCIALRTMVVTPGSAPAAWRYDIQAGAGIVADSDPASEYQETLNKAQALLAAVQAAAGTG